VKNNIQEYKKQIEELRNKQTEIFNYINATIAPFLPVNTEFTRKVSFFFINDADGWGFDDISAIDLNFHKDNYTNLLRTLAHEVTTVVKQPLQ
jgi:hypothetical protein